ncbi:FAD-binding oxidoreductase [Pseudonocardia thermophila]|uniref:FAD-binding oxidoreductase n=1 Tax=Pseudonocardia thermophila TaxID=1848 RepID=UPI00248EFFB4|nr:FAD-binding protein [Pseudonocardia thermophila]
MTASMLHPTDLKELRDAVLDSSGTLGIAGAGTAADWAGPLGPVDAVLDTTGLAGIVVHNPGDMTVAVRAGTPLRQLQEELAPHHQRVSLDAARVAEGATVGGLVATGDAGPCGLAFGSMRDLVIGVTLVLADGTVARSGGHVIKNVAGYDLAKLLHGSYGTLAVIAEVVLRLHPVPEREATLAVSCSLTEAAELARAVLAGPHEAVALEWLGTTPDAGTLLVRLNGTAAAMDARLDRLRPVLPGAVDGDDRWAEHAAIVRGGPGDAVLRIGVRPSKLPGVLTALPARAITAGLGTGIATVVLDAQDVAAAHETVAAAGGTSVLRRRPAGASVPAWGPPPSALKVLRAVKQSLDPAGRLGPGRFDPWM